MFDNKWSYIDKKFDNMLSYHFIKYEINQAGPLMYVTLIAVFILFA